MDFGAFAGGMATGLAPLPGVLMHQEDMARRRRMEDLTTEKELRDRLKEAVKIVDPDVRKVALNQIVDFSKKTFGAVMPNDVVNMAKNNPEHFLKLMEMGEQQGLTMGQSVQLLQNPLAVVDMMVALDQQKRRVAALPGAETTPTTITSSGTAPTTATPTTTTPEVPTVPGLTPELALEVKKRQDQIIQLRKDLARVAAGGDVLPPQVTSGELTSIRTEIGRLQGEITSITTTPQLEKMKEGRQPVSQAEVDAARSDAQNLGIDSRVALRMFQPGMTRQDMQDRLSLLRGGKPPQPTPASDKAAPGPATPTALPGAAAPKEIPLTDQAKLEARLATENDAAKRRKIADELIGASFKDFEGIRSAGDTARGMKDTLDVITAAALRVGTTGPWITPVRETVNSLAQLLGVQNPQGQPPLELIKAMNARLAVAMTSQMKGQQSDKELFLSIVSNTGQLQTPQGLAVMAYATGELAKRNIAREVLARRWLADPSTPTLDTKNQQGQNFQEAFDASVASYNKQYGSLAERIGKAFQMDPKALLRGMIKNAP